MSALDDAFYADDIDRGPQASVFDYDFYSDEDDENTSVQHHVPSPADKSKLTINCTVEAPVQPIPSRGSGLSYRSSSASDMNTHEKPQLPGGVRGPAEAMPWHPSLPEGQPTPAEAKFFALATEARDSIEALPSAHREPEMGAASRILTKEARDSSIIMAKSGADVDMPAVGFKPSRAHRLEKLDAEINASA